MGRVVEAVMFRCVLEMEDNRVREPFTGIYSFLEGV